LIAYGLRGRGMQGEFASEAQAWAGHCASRSLLRTCVRAPKLRNLNLDGVWVTIS
jgi:hypothetical protein